MCKSMKGDMQYGKRIVMAQANDIIANIIKTVAPSAAYSSPFKSLARKPILRYRIV